MDFFTAATFKFSQRYTIAFSYKLISCTLCSVLLMCVFNSYTRKALTEVVLYIMFMIKLPNDFF